MCIKIDMCFRILQKTFESFERDLMCQKLKMSYFIFIDNGYKFVR